MGGLEVRIAEVMARTHAADAFRTSYPGVVWPFSEILLRAIQVCYLRHHEDPDAEARFLSWMRDHKG